VSANPATDPMGFFRDMLGQWEQMGNQVGSKMMESKEFAQLMHQGSAASMQAQNAVQEAMAKALAAANIPSKADIDALGARLLAVEKQVALIAAAVGGSGTTSATPKPSRNRRPPKSGE
jgi:polyhydroxyalkanoate synthesis regulator phasin